MKTKSFYDLTKEEITKYQEEFNKTPYGRIQMINRAASLIIFIVIFIAVLLFEYLFVENAQIITFFEYIGSFALLYFIANCIFNNINLKIIFQLNIILNISNLNFSVNKYPLTKLVVFHFRLKGFIIGLY